MTQPRFTWSRYPEIGAPGYEVSTQGDRRFSALAARIPHPDDPRHLATIEEVYQLDVKGYRRVTSDWKIGKGRPPINGKSNEQLWEEYLGLWRVFIDRCPAAWVEELRIRAMSAGYHLTDCFAKRDINQARALATILSERYP